MTNPTEAGRPLVSCIMPTHDRRPFVGHAVAQFLRQDYPHRELIVIDDGSDPVRDLVPDHPAIHYVRLETRRNLGAKRNLACREAKGEVIVHWDDDDWMAPWRLTYQVGELLARKADVCGLDSLFFWDPRAGKAWRYTWPAGHGAWAAGGTLCYTRAFWQRNPFPDLTIGEDNHFLSRTRAMRLAVLPDPSFYVALVHPRNTSPKRPSGARWRPVEEPEVRTLVGEDEAFYRGAAATPSPTLPRSAGEGAPALAGRKAAAGFKEAAGPAAAGLHVTVSIPFHSQHADTRMLRRAIESILRQTHRELTVVVVNDGGPPPWSALADLDDPRLVRFDLPANRGRYFADAVVLAAARGPYYLVQDADDWSEPQRVATLLRRLRAEHADGAVSAARRHHPGTGRGTLAVVATAEAWPALARPLTATFEHRANHHGLFRADALRDLGGYYGGFRIGYDTLLVNLLLMTGRLAWVEEPLYHRTIHAASLSNARETGMRSAARRQAAERLRRLYGEAFAAYRLYLEGARDREELCAEIRRIVAAGVPREEGAELAREAERLGALLASPAKTEAPAPVQPPKTAPAAPGSSPGSSPGKAPVLLDAPRLPWSDWGIDKAFARELLRDLDAARPRRLLEVGSGTSTLLLADWAARHGASLVSLEHEPRFHAQTAALLERFGLRGRVELKLARLEPFACGDGRHPWYAVDLSGPFDFVLVDGPPERVGRQAALFAVAPHLAARWRLWLHDGLRPHEQGCVHLWSRWFDFSRTLSAASPRGALRLEGRAEGVQGPRRAARAGRPWGSAC